jgi:hypothetical protein
MTDAVPARLLHQLDRAEARRRSSRVAAVFIAAEWQRKFNEGHRRGVRVSLCVPDEGPPVPQILTTVSIWSEMKLRHDLIEFPSENYDTFPSEQLRGQLMLLL